MILVFNLIAVTRGVDIGGREAVTVQQQADEVGRGGGEEGAWMEMGEGCSSEGWQAIMRNRR